MPITLQFAISFNSISRKKRDREDKREPKNETSNWTGPSCPRG